jgi:hypothetical protein
MTTLPRLVKLPAGLWREGLRARLPRNGNFRDRTGENIDASRVLGYAGTINSFSVWLCRCHCGNRFLATSSELNRRRVDCGCRRRTAVSKTRLYKLWHGVVSRCHNKRDRSYPRYGGQGIRVCRSWRRSLDEFLTDMGPPPSNQHVLERLDKRRDYEPANCRWATRSAVSRSRAELIEHAGQKLTAGQWARRLGLSQQAMSRRILLCKQHGADLSEAVSTPARSRLPCMTSPRAARPSGFRRPRKDDRP